MDSSQLVEIVILVILLALSALFSAAETALMTLSKIRMRHMVEDGVKGAELIQKVKEKPSKLLGALLIGNNAANIASSAIATSLFINMFGEGGVGIATVVMTVLVLIFAEIIPKSLAAQDAEGMSLRVIKSISVIVNILNPFVVVFTYVTNGIIRLFGGNIDTKQPFITEEELKTIVDVSQEEGVLEAEEKEMIYNVFQFGELYAKDVMIQRMDIAAIDVESTYDEILEVVRQEKYSRIPVYEESIDNIVGILNVKDLVILSSERENFNLRDCMREPFYTYEFKKLDELFEEMKSGRYYMGIVVDEYGGTSGIVTLEDLIEEIVGEIEDEYDEQYDEIRVIKENEYLVMGFTRIEDINEVTGINIESEEFDSIGGFIIGEIGHLPQPGETVEYGNVKFVVESVDKNRVEKVRIFT